MLIAKNIAKWTLAGLFIWFFLLMCRITLFYVPFSPTASFLNIKQTEVNSLPLYLPVFYTHVYSSIFVLLAGCIQFLPPGISTKKFTSIPAIYTLSDCCYSLPLPEFIWGFMQMAVFIQNCLLLFWAYCGG